MMKNKAIITVSAIALVLVLAIGGTVAWLTSKTDPVTNTFTYGDINIDLWEHKIGADGQTLENEVVRGAQGGYKMIPGNKIDKDPTVTVKANSEACYLFVKVEKSNNFDSFMTYAMADGWTELTNVIGVYYRDVQVMTEDTNFPVLKANDENNQITVKDNVTKTMLNDLVEDGDGKNLPTLTFTAYAVQKSKDNNSEHTAAEAWSIINPSTT